MCRILSLTAWVLACSAAVAQPIRPPGMAGDVGPPPPPTGGFDDRWLGRMAVEKLRQYSGTGEYAALAPQLKGAILARLSCGRADKLGALTDLIYAFRACAYLPMAEDTPGGADLVRWLVDHKEVSQTLFRAMEDVDKPANALAAFWELISADEKAVLSHPDLAVAFATSKPMKHYRPQPGACTMVEAFRWYAHPSVKMRYDLRKMPYELSRYLATSRLGIAERRWAVKRYGERTKPVKAYFDLKYDSDYFYGKKPRRIADKPYTLANLRTAGGVCIEQAYYAVEVCRAMGIPAAIVRGKAASGSGHAWAACLRIGGGRAYWDADTGRYEQHRYYTGKVRDAATGRSIPDAEVMLVGAAAQLPRYRRRQADAAVALARLVDRVADKTPRPDLTMLSRWARQYDWAGGEGDKGAKASVGWLAAKREIDRSLTEELLAAAIDRNLACKGAWDLLVELRRTNRLPVERLDRFFQTLIGRTAKEYPDYSCSLVMRVIPTIPDPARREKVFRKALGIYARRPDLQGRITIALGDDYAGRDLSDKALKAYELAAVKAAVGEVMLSASGKAEKLLRDNGRKKAAITMYRKLLPMAKKRWSSAGENVVRKTLTQRLAALLSEAGREDEARKLRRSK